MSRLSEHRSFNSTGSRQRSYTSRVLTEAQGNYSWKRGGDYGRKSRSKQSASLRMAAARGSMSAAETTQVETLRRDTPMKIIIAGAPASGKGTQCELIVKKLGLTHISAGDLLREQVRLGTDNGKTAKEYMDRGDLVPDSVVIDMVKARLDQDDAKANGWLLDGYPRSGSQAAALEEAGIRPELFIVLEVPDEVLIERVVGRRLDPETGKIYHMTFDPPPEEILSRLTTRSDDTEEKAKNRLATHEKNVNAVVNNYNDIICYIDGNRPKTDVFSEIEEKITTLVKA